MTLLLDRSPWTSTCGAVSSSGIQYSATRFFWSSHSATVPPGSALALARTILRLIFDVIQLRAVSPERCQPLSTIIRGDIHYVPRCCICSKSRLALATAWRIACRSLRQAGLVSFQINGLPAAHPSAKYGVLSILSAVGSAKRSGWKRGMRATSMRRRTPASRATRRPTCGSVRPP